MLISLHWYYQMKVIQKSKCSSNLGPTIVSNQPYQQHTLNQIGADTSIQNLVLRFQVYVPHSTTIAIEALRKSPSLKLKKYKSSAYYGEFLNDHRHGQGIMLYFNGTIYEGEWENDFKHGKGYEKFHNLCVYEGDYLNGKPEGVGRYTWPNGQYYQGEWKNGLKHGSGEWRGSKGDSYIGQWKCGAADGFGVHVWVNGDIYEGEFKQSLKHGEGMQKFRNSDIYKGQYQNGKPCGYGEYYWANGSYFKGQFKNGLRDGEGTWKKSKGYSDKYQGQYSNDKKSGYGTFSWANGNIYKGNYQSDMRHGYGQMYWNDGSYYKGHWQQGAQHGLGLLHRPLEGTVKGVFDNGELVQVESDGDSRTNLNNYIRVDEGQARHRIEQQMGTHMMQSSNLRTLSASKASFPSREPSADNRAPQTTSRKYRINSSCNDNRGEVSRLHQSTAKETRDTKQSGIIVREFELSERSKDVPKGLHTSFNIRRRSWRAGQVSANR